MAYRRWRHGLAVPVLGEVVHGRELHHSGEHEHERHGDVDVERRGVGDARQVASRLEAEKRHRQHRHRAWGVKEHVTRTNRA